MKQDPSLPFPKVHLTTMRRPACFQYALTEHPTRHRREAKWVAKVKGFPMATIALCPGCLKVAKAKGKLAGYRRITDEERTRETSWQDRGALVTDR